MASLKVTSPGIEPSGAGFHIRYNLTRNGHESIFCRLVICTNGLGLGKILQPFRPGAETWWCMLPIWPCTIHKNDETWMSMFLTLKGLLQ